MATRFRCLAALLVLFALGGAGQASGATPAYEDLVLNTRGLVSYWRLGETSGSVATDQRGLQAGSYAGAPALGTPGALYANPNASADFGAASDYLTVPHRSEYNVNAFTIELWVHLDSYGNTTTYRRIASKGAGVAERNWLLALGSNSNGQVIYGFGDGTAIRGRRSNAQLQLNRWHLLHFVHRAGDRMQLYIDGELDSEQVDASTPVVSSAPIRLASDGGSEFTDARYDEFAIYDRSLSADEIRQHYQAAAVPDAVCDKYASTTGLDANPGTAANPYRTPDKLSSSLSSGQVGCLRGGLYALSSTWTVRNAGVILRSYPGELATVKGRVVVAADGVALEALTLNGNCGSSACLPSPTINGADVAIRDADIFNENTGICVHPTGYGGFVPDRFVIERNRIHNCGKRPPANHDHGIYVADGTGGVIRDNAIFDNADRGIQLYPSAHHVTAYNNTGVPPFRWTRVD